MRLWIVLITSVGLAGLLTMTGPSQAAPSKGQQPAGVPPETYLSEFAVRTTTPPRRDNYLLNAQLRGSDPNTPRTTTKRTYKVGDQDDFTVFDLQLKRPYKVTASVVAVTPHLYMFVDNNYGANRGELANLAQQFENNVYPTTRQFFGSEDTPGVDNDPHLVILNTPLKLASGYFSSDDIMLRSINPNSNEREMFYIATNPGAAGAYLSTLSHEFQHMIEYHSLPNQDIWLNEGSSVLSQVLNGYGSGGLEVPFLNEPNTQLGNWACSACGTSRYYGAGYSWLSFLNDHYGFEAVRNIAQNGKGLTGFNAVDYALYADGQPGQTNQTVLKQFALANYLNRRTADKAYNYQKITARTDQIQDINPGPTKDDLVQYGTGYYKVSAGAKGFSLDFKGPATVAVTGAGGPHGGQYAWWSNRGDDSQMNMTRPVDLTSVRSATFKFWAWFDLEPNYDWAYVEVSTDNGQHWQILPAGKLTTDRDPTGKQYGPGMTGQSKADGLDVVDTEDVRAVWSQATVDLSKFAGQKILLRLDYLTDEGYNRSGIVLDDFEIPEIGWKDDAESGPGDWTVSGFVRTNMQLPQHFWVQVIRQDGPCGQANTTDLAHADNGQSCIQDVPLDSTNAGQRTFPYQQAIVVVSPWAVKTLVPASFQLTLK